MPKPTKKDPRLKYVKKAKQWVVTYFEGDKQIQLWLEHKPDDVRAVLGGDGSDQEASNV